MAPNHKVSVLLAAVCLFGIYLVGAQAMSVGGPKDISNFPNSVEIDELANFAVDQYKSRQNSIAVITFSKVLSAKEQVVQGKMYYFTIEVMENGVPKNYDAKVWVKPWEGYKELESFLPSAPSHYDSAVDSDAKSGDCYEKSEIAT
ncbi:cysteine proteinase inhibitor A [Physcomitrium patens]|uniref:Cysteine proteinase inhibitor n=1 Tax=Physcomitrium patens TaxID=3218 RepID=A0A2K1JMD0_PHYPA|nr:cysteine proteinase inhibitor A-like [Physcomitrium patens]PNR42710.1 hypothetical protein PHYPA_017540 [Physcomitrium patens]|eukprot:XP_024392352.1 cysteine proteinase inhibitor A-like [Physcomitrella patens]